MMVKVMLGVVASVGLRKAGLPERAKPLRKPARKRTQLLQWGIIAPPFSPFRLFDRTTRDMVHAC